MSGAHKLQRNARFGLGDKGANIGRALPIRLKDQVDRHGVGRVLGEHLD